MSFAKLISLPHCRCAGETANYIHTCRASDKTEAFRIDRLSRRVGLCKTVLMHAFKQRYSISIRAYIIQVRMQKACSLLEQTDLSIKTIALWAGYAELSNFSRDFSRHKQLSPSGYRRLKRSVLNKEAGTLVTALQPDILLIKPSVSLEEFSVF